MRRHRAGRGSRNGQDTSLRTATDVLRIVKEELEQVRTNPDLAPHWRARLIAELADVALRAIELSTLEAPDDSDQRPFTLVLGRPISQTPIQPSQ